MGDKAPNRINIVDPNNFDYQSAANSVFADKNYNMSVPTEDLCIIVELETETKPRTILNTSQNKNSAISSGDKTLSVKFINGQDFLDKKNYLTTSYTELNTELGRDIDEALGITDINIDFNTAYAPMVTINFIDIRGGALFQNGAKSKFNVLFRMPYPIFSLTVKGYYGKPVRYCLHMLKCNTKFNSQTGNFEITAQFVGYTYAMLNDMIMGYLKAAEYMKKGRQKADSRGVQTILDYMKAVSDIDKNVKAKLLTNDDEDVKNQQVIADMRPILEDMKTLCSNAITQLTTDSVIPIFEVPSFSSEGFELKDTAACLDLEFDTSWNYVENDAYKKVIEIRTKFDEKMDELVKKYNDKAGGNETLKISDEKQYRWHGLQFLANEDFSSQLNRDNITEKYFDCTTDCIDKKIERNKKIAEVPIGAYNSDNNNNASFTNFDFIDIWSTIRDKEKALNDEEKAIQERLAEKLKQIVNELGIDTSIRGTFNVFTTAVEVFLELLHEVSTAASDKNNKARYDELKKFANSKENGLDNPKKAFDKEYVYPWPEYHENDVEKYLGAAGVLENPLNVDEVRFTEELYEAMIKVAREEEKLEALLGGDAKSWVSFNPLDSILFNRDETNPYSRIADGANHDVLAKVIVLRAVGFLGYANRGLTEEEIITASNAEVRLILDRFKDDTKIINALKNAYDSVDAYAAVKGKHNSGTEYTVFKSTSDLTYTYYNTTQAQLLPVKTVYNSDKDGDVTTNLTAIVAATYSDILTGFDITDSALSLPGNYVNDVSSYIILDSEAPPNSLLDFGVNYTSVSAVPPVATNSLFKVGNLQNIDRFKDAEPTKLADAGFSIGAGTFGVQEFFTADFSGAKYITGDDEEITYTTVNSTVPFFTLFYDNTKINAANESAYNTTVDPVSWIEFKTCPSLSGTGNDFVGNFVAPSLCLKRAEGYQNYFDFKYNNNGDIPVATVGNDDFRVRLRSSFAFREGIGNNIALLSFNIGDISFPYLTYGVTTKAGAEDQVPLFGSKFYYAQNKIGRAFLFLHALPWRGLTRQVSGAYGPNFENSKQEQNAGLFSQNEISAIFGNRTGFIQVPYLWPIFIGALLKRFRLGNVTSNNTWYGPYAQPIQEFKIDETQPSFTADTTNNHNEYGRDILRWDITNGVTAINGIAADRPQYYPKTYQYLRWQSISGFKFDESASICFQNNVYSELSETNGALAYTKLDDEIIRLPKAVQDEFIRKFDEFVEKDWDNIRANLEIRLAGYNNTPEDGSVQQITTIYQKLRDATTLVGTTNGLEGTIPFATINATIADNGGTVDKKCNFLSIVHVDPAETDPKKTKYENCVYFEYADDSDAVQTLKTWLTKTTIISNNSYILFNKLKIKSTQGTANNTPALKSQTFITIDKQKEFTPYITNVIQSIKNFTSGNTQEIIGQQELESIKLEIYRHLKKIYDTWIAASNNPDGVIFQCCLAGIGNRLPTDTDRAKARGEGTVRLIDSFRFIDRAYRDIGNLFQVNPHSAAKQLIDSTDSSFYDFTGRILNDYNFDFIALPNFINYNDEKEIKDVFKPYPYYEVKTSITPSGPSFVCVYVGQTSTKLDFGTDGDYPNDGFDLNDPTQWPKDFTEDLNDNSPDKAAAFIVKYGHQNQNIFKDIILDQAEHSATAESLMITDNISTSLSKVSRSYFGQNLYDVYSVRSYKAEIEMMGDAMIQPMMYFQLDNIPMFHGAYLITRVKHSIKPNHMTTTFSGNRIKAVATPILDAATLYEGLIATYAIPAGDGTGTLNITSNCLVKYKAILLENSPTNKTIENNVENNGKAVLATEVTKTANKELEEWNNGTIKESDSKGKERIALYWHCTEDPNKYDLGPHAIPSDPWSSAFVSYVMSRADAEFPVAGAHVDYITKAMDGENGYEVFALGAGLKIKAEIGDIMSYPREGGYNATHSDIIYKIENNVAFLIGGNYSKTCKTTAQITLDGGYITDAVDVKNYILITKKTNQKYYAGKKLSKITPKDNTSANIKPANNNIKITPPPADDIEIYKAIITGIGATVTDENLKACYAWRQAEGAKAAWNPFNTTQKMPNVTSYNCVPVRNYATRQDGIDATVKTLLNGRYNKIVNGFKNNEGAYRISTYTDELSTWGTGIGMNRALAGKNLNPPDISRTSVQIKSC